jgi:hypothetical protein
LITVPLVAAFILLIFSFCLGDFTTSAWNLTALILYWAGVFGTLPMMERGIRNKLRERNEALKPWTFGTIWRTLVAIPLTQMVYISALFWLHFMKRVEWRGVWYEIRKDKTVELTEYIPYGEIKKEVLSQVDETISL